MTPQPTFPETILAKLAELDWSQAQLARRTGLHPGVLSRLITRKREATVEHLDRIARAFNSTAQALFGTGDGAEILTRWVQRSELEAMTTTNEALTRQNALLHTQRRALEQEVHVLRDAIDSIAGIAKANSR